MDTALTAGHLLLDNCKMYQQHLLVSFDYYAKYEHSFFQQNPVHILIKQSIFKHFSFAAGYNVCTRLQEHK